VEGPVMLFLTTTAIDIDEELLNRCMVLTVNESREQTQRIHELQRQRQTLEGLLLEADKSHITHVHQNAQRLIRPLLVANPFANQLTFLDTQTRTRRDHMKYLTLMRAIALLHQYQRPIKRIERSGQTLEYIEVEAQDIELANTLAHEVLGRTLDELPPQTRKLLTLITPWVQQQCQADELTQRDYRFSRRDIREATGWGNTQIRVHVERLLDMEYLLAHRGGRGQTFTYELVYQGEGSEGDLFLSGLIMPKKVHNSDHLAGQKGDMAGPKRPQNGALSAPLRGAQKPIKPFKIKAFTLMANNSPKKHLLRPLTNVPPLATNGLHTELHHIKAQHIKTEHIKTSQGAVA